MPFKEQTLACLAMSPAGRALNTFQSVPELLCAFRNPIKAHRSLFLDGNTSHRDVSKNNIIITGSKEANGLLGTLIDMNLVMANSLQQHK